MFVAHGLRKKVMGVRNSGPERNKRRSKQESNQKREARERERQTLFSTTELSSWPGIPKGQKTAPLCRGHCRHNPEARHTPKKDFSRVSR